MAVKRPFGKDDPTRFIDGALTGSGSGTDHETYQDSSTSSEIEDSKIDRPSQSIKRAYALDNVGRVYGRIPTSLKDDHFAGGVDNIKHSLTASSAVNEEVGAAGKVKHTIIADH